MIRDTTNSIYLTCIGYSFGEYTTCSIKNLELARELDGTWEIENVLRDGPVEHLGIEQDSVPLDAAQELETVVSRR